MAENAERSIQEMIPQLQAMERIGLCTAIEARKILKKRREFEYKLRRKTKEKKDFLQYIKYEQLVLDLVKQRRKKGKCTGMRKEIDVCIVRRVHRLFEIACSRFPGSLDLWKEHLKFCQKRKEKSTMEKIFVNMMKFHPHNEDLWIMFAKHQLEYSVSVSRTLFQRAIRANEKSRQLYEEYFEMELNYADKLRKRQEVLEIKDLESKSSLMRGEIAFVIYDNAIKILEDGPAFCLSLFKIIRQFPFAAWIEDKIYDDMKDHFANNEHAMACLAKRPLVSFEHKSENDSETFTAAVKATCEQFEVALTQVSSGLMWELYLKTCLEMAKLSPTSTLCNWAVDQSMKIFLRAIEKEKMTEQMALCWTEMIVKTGQVSLGLDVIPLLTAKFQDSVPLWYQQIKFHILTDVSSDNIVSCLHNSLKHTRKKNESALLWKIVIEWAIISCPHRITNLFEEGISSESREVCLLMKELFMDWAATHLNIKSVRKLYKRLSAPPMSLELHYKYIGLELSQVAPKMKKIRLAFDFVLLEFGASDIDVWIKYIEMEMKHRLGDPGAVAILSDRAKRTLNKPLSKIFEERSVLFHLDSNCA